MKITHTLASFTLILCATLAQVQAGEQSSAPPAPAKAALGVEALMKNVERHRGHMVSVEGVVSSVSASDHMLGLIDFREFRECGLEGCAELTLPVRWAGAIPVAGQAARVEGEVREADGKLVFVARALEKTALPKAKNKG